LLELYQKGGFPEKQELKASMFYMMNQPDGGQVPVKISNVFNGTGTLILIIFFIFFTKNLFI
jgi:hypothetical protein